MFQPTSGKRKASTQRFILYILIIGLLLAGCSPSAAPNTTKTSQEVLEATSAPSPTTPEEAVQASGPQKGGQLVVAIPGNIETIDPHHRSGLFVQLEIINNLYAQAFSYPFVWNEDKTAGVVDNSNWTTWLADSAKFSDDFKVFTYTFPKGLLFANGDPIDKDAIQYTFDRWFETEALASRFFGNLDVPRENINIKEDEDHIIVEMTTNTPNTLLPLLHTNASLYGIVNPRQVKPHVTEDDPWGMEWLRNNDAGAGPYKLEKWGSDEIILTRNENYFEEGLPYFDKIVYKVVPDPATRVALLQAGTVDVAYELPLDSIPDLENDPSLTVYREPSTEIVYLTMNNGIPPFDNKLVRQAISYAIPYDVIVEEVTQGYGQRLMNYVPKGMPGHDPDGFKYNNDLDKAREILAEAGYPDGFSTEFSIQSGIAEDEQVAIWVQSALKDIGIDVKINKMPTASYFEQRRLLQIPFYLQTGWTTTTNDPWNHFYWTLRAECCNYADYQNEDVWQMIDDYFLYPDPEERIQAAVRAQEILMEDAPWVLLYQPDYILVTKSNIKGVLVDPLVKQNHFRYWYFEN